MKLTDFKLNERVKRVVSKLFDKELSIEELFMDKGANSDDYDSDVRPS